ncbi:MULTISPECIES: hypothetical protein [Pandoraea]|uniref:hypothetical protein n=1 Tax=Pandoraea TaxID=93217 RepID=UPI0003D1D2FD|nr:MULTISPECIES: hypothetical protein [Pandoraea]AHB77575.1 hypothetical protein X636_20620 [Pandoraea pnomenusa]
MDAYAVAVIELFGGTTKTAEFFDIEPPSVSEWKKTGIPKARLQTLQHAKPDLLAAAAKACEPTPA